MSVEGIQNRMEQPPKRILEIGAGGNPLVEELKRCGIDVGEAVITDHDPDTLSVKDSNQFRRWDASPVRNKERDNELLYVAARVNKLPFRDASFTNIIAANVFGDPSMKLEIEKGLFQNAYFAPANSLAIDQLFKELYRVLDTEGEICIFETYSPDEAWSFFEKNKDTWTKYFSYSEDSNLISTQIANGLLSYREGHGLLFALIRK